jgi:hypothetical protein
MEFDGLRKSSSDLNLIVGGFDGGKVMGSERKQVKIDENLSESLEA